MSSTRSTRDVAKTVLYISYNGFSNPLTHTQVLPYLERLAGPRLRFRLVTFEPPGGAPVTETREGAALSERLARANIQWQALAYHKRPSLLATLWDIAAGAAAGVFLHLRGGRFAAVHARGHVPAAMALALKRLLGIPFVFDMRGMLADEYVDAGNWRDGSVNYRLTKWAEGQFLRSADAVVVLTERIHDYLASERRYQGHELADRLTVIPCCVDVGSYRELEKTRAEVRARLGLEDRFVVVYSGSVGTWYLLDEMLAFFSRLIEKLPNAHLLLLNRHEHATIARALGAAGLARVATLVALAPDEVPGYLAAADVGMFFIKPTFAKSASSPTKLGEYLAAGLPVVANRGVGDVDALIEECGVGILVDGLSAEAYDRAGDQVVGLAARLRQGGRAEMGARSRATAERYLSLERGTARYREVYARLGLV